MRGRKPTPTALKLVNGNPGRRPIGKTVQPAVEPPPCPDHLSADAKDEWKRTLPILLDLRVLSAIDMAALAMYCQSYARWVHAERKIAELEASAEAGYVIESPNGFPVQSPWLAIANSAMEKCKSFLVEFGMTPSARARIGTPSQQLDMFDGQAKSPDRYFS